MNDTNEYRHAHMWTHNSSQLKHCHNGVCNPNEFTEVFRGLIESNETSQATIEKQSSTFWCGYAFDSVKLGSS